MYKKILHIDYIKKHDYFLIHTKIVKCISIDNKNKRFYFLFVEPVEPCWSNAIGYQLILKITFEYNFDYNSLYKRKIAIFYW